MTAVVQKQGKNYSISHGRSKQPVLLLISTTKRELPVREDFPGRRELLGRGELHLVYSGLFSRSPLASVCLWGVTYVNYEVVM